MDAYIRNRPTTLGMTLVEVMISLAILVTGVMSMMSAMSSDREFTLWPKAGAELTLDLAKSSFRLPVVGGVSALQKAGMR